MTALELTTWSGVDAGGPFLMMFGHIDTIMQWSRLRNDGKVIGFGTCTEVDVDTMTVADTSGDGRFNSFIAGASFGSCDWSITSGVLTLTMGGVTIKVRQE